MSPNLKFIIGFLLSVSCLSGIALESDLSGLEMPDWTYHYDPAPPMVLFKMNAGQHLTPSQQDFPYAEATRDYLDAHCATDEKGDPDWRIMHKEDDMKLQSPEFQALANFDTPQLPAVVIGKGHGKIIQFPIPPDVTEESGIELLKKNGVK